MIASAPCKLCTDRYVGCHSSCEKYIEFRINKDEDNRMKKEYLSNGVEHLGFMKEQKTKRIRSKR